MGASLPAISRWVELTPRGVSRLGFLYGGNIGGPVVKDVSAQLTRQFAECLQGQLQAGDTAGGTAARSPVPAAAKPVGGFMLLFRSLRARFRSR